MVAGYGIAVDGLPLDVPTADGVSARIRLRWSAERHQVSPPSGSAPVEWIREEEDALVVGWARYAEYRVARSLFPSASAVLMGADEEQAALGFLLSVLPLALPLFGLEPMHGSAVTAGAGAVLLLGASGSGKSTLASRLAGMGWRFLADDACAIDRRGSLWPAPPLLARRSKGEPWREISPYNDKTVVHLPAHRPDPVRPGGVAVLAPEPGAPLNVHPLDSLRAFRALLGHARAPRAFTSRRRALQLHVVSGLVRLPVVEVSYEHGRHQVAEVAEALAAWAATTNPPRTAGAAEEGVA